MGRSIDAETRTGEGEAGSVVSAGVEGTGRSIAAVVRSGTGEAGTVSAAGVEGTGRSIAAVVRSGTGEAGTVGTAGVEGTGTAIFIPPPTLDGPDQALLWPARAQWSSTVQETFRFRTEVLRSRQGAEQRVAQRNRPRRAIQFETLLDPVRMRRAAMFSAAQQAQLKYVAHPRDVVKLREAAVAGERRLLLETLPTWIARGRQVVLETREGSEIARVDTVTGTRANLVTPLIGNFEAGTRVVRAIFGRVVGGTRVRAVASRVGTVQIVFEEEVENAWHDAALTTVPNSVQIVNGKEYFDIPAQWSDGVTVQFQQSRDNLDLGRGVFDGFFPEMFTNRRTQVGLLLATPEQYASLVGLFYRAKGKQQSFYTSGLVDEIRPSQDVASANTTIRFAGVEFSNAFDDQRIYKRLVIVADGVRSFHEVDDIAVSGNNSVVTLTAAVGRAIEVENIRFMSWVLLTRFEADLLTLNWRTANVATASMALHALEDLV